ncbi:MAG: hypothetical protein R3223_04390 [Longimicrobiales bacterium]|nr:hypothetical protein [Longimicrobiales bacterium]
MDNSVETARHILSRHPGPALPYTELHHLVSLELSGPAPRPGDLLRRIRARSDLFRLLDPGRGPWRTGGITRRRDSTSTDLPCSTDLPWLEAWILLAPGDEEEWTGPEDAHAPPRHRGSFPRVRASVLNLGRTLDDASPTALCRWLLIAREERSLRQRILAQETGLPS